MKLSHYTVTYNVELASILPNSILNQESDTPIMKNLQAFNITYYKENKDTPVTDMVITDGDALVAAAVFRDHYPNHMITEVSHYRTMCNNIIIDTDIFGD